VALQSSGAISLGDLKTEFGDTGSSSLSEFYRGGSLVPNTGTNAAVPTSGEIQLSDFYGAEAAGWQWTQTYTSMNEGVTRTFQFEDTSGATTSGTFNWSINGTTADFNAVSGSGTINASSQGSFSITTKNDATTEGTENYTVSVTYSSSTILTQAFSVLDTSQDSVTIDVARSTTSVNEGSSFTFSATATVPITGTVSFSLGGTATDSSDYNTSGASTGTTGQFTFSNSTTSDTLTVTTVADSTTEGSETVSCTISSPSVSGFDPSIGTSNTSVTINDTSTGTPTVTINAVRSTSSVNEGNAFTFSASATEAITGTVDFTITGTATDSSDYNTSGASTGTTGQFTFSNSTTSDTLTVTTVADSTTEGSETVRCTISNPSVSGYIESIGTASRTVTINDTSQDPPVTPEYDFSAASYNVSEGSSRTITVNTSNVANGTTLYWSLASDPGNDIVTDSGSFTINSNTGSFSVTAASDSNNESTETLTLQLRTGSTSGTIQDTANLNILNVASINLTPATDTLSILDDDGTVSASGGIQLEGTSSADTYNIGTIIDGFQTTDHSNVWITGGDPADYEARVTVTSGTVNSNVSFTNFGTGTSVGTWTTLSSTNYVWSWQTTSQLTNTFTITLQIRDSATQTVQDSATVELNFETVFVPA